jgi:hypothetical protein
VYVVEGLDPNISYDPNNVNNTSIPTQDQNKPISELDKTLDHTKDVNPFLVTGNVSLGVTSIDRYQDPGCKENEYIYCLDGQVECQDIFGNSMGDPLKLPTDYTVGNTFALCGSYLNKIDMADFKNEPSNSIRMIKSNDISGSDVFISSHQIILSNIDGTKYQTISLNNQLYYRAKLKSTTDQPYTVVLTPIDTTSEGLTINGVNEQYVFISSKMVKGILAYQYDTVQCNTASPWRVGGDGTVAPFKGCYPDTTSASNAFSDSSGKNDALIDGANVYILSSILPNTLGIDQSSSVYVNGLTYYKGVIKSVNQSNLIDVYVPDLNGILIQNVSPDNLSLTSNNYSLALGKSLSEVNKFEYPRPVCKKGSFTTCSAKPPFTIKDGKYIPTTFNIESVVKNIPTKKDANVVDVSHKKEDTNVVASNYYDGNEIPNTPFLKCIADFGTNIGDKLCCGVNDTLKNTKFVCAESQPYCKGYVPGTQYGICTDD